MQTRPMLPCGVCVSVTVVDCVKTNKHIFKLFSPEGSHTVLIFRPTRYGNIRMEATLTGALNPGAVGIIRDSEPVSGFTGCCERFQWQVQYT